MPHEVAKARLSSCSARAARCAPRGRAYTAGRLAAQRAGIELGDTRCAEVVVATWEGRPAREFEADHAYVIWRPPVAVAVPVLRLA